MKNVTYKRIMDIEVATLDKHARWKNDLAVGTHDGPFGTCFIATSDNALCRLEFIDDRPKQEALDRLTRLWPETPVTEDTHNTRFIYNALMQVWQGSINPPLKLLLRGTSFQCRVWSALINIPQGTTTTYEAIAQSIGHPRAVRAVGTAIGQNPISLIIPCHRVIRKDGRLGGYAWGPRIKKALLQAEAPTQKDM